MNAIDLLISQHRSLESKFEDLLAAKEAHDPVSIVDSDEDHRGALHIDQQAAQEHVASAFTRRMDFCTR